MLAEAGLSFLGFGVQPPNASWGVMLQDAYSRITSAPWPMIPPGVAIALTVLAFNLVGDGLRDSLGREVFKVKGVR
jgi:ABC-type dipeptide/oligopeptide/nickel transport system permease subunit